MGKMAKSAVEKDLEEKLKSAQIAVLTSEKKAQEVTTKQDIYRIFETEDVKIIRGYLRILKQAHQYAQSKVGIQEKLTGQERYKRLEEDRAHLMKVLETYEPDQKIHREELSEKTGFSFRQLWAYSHAKKNPLLIKVDKEHYQLGRLLKKNPLEKDL